MKQLSRILIAAQLLLFITINSNSLELYSENFESYSVSTDMTTHDWTWTQYSTNTGSYLVSAGKYGEVIATSGPWAGGYHYDATGTAAWDDYDFDFDVASHVSGRIKFSFRTGVTNGYWCQILPGVQCRVFKAQRDGITGISADLSNTVPPGSLTSVKVVLSGNSILIYLNGSETPEVNVTDSSYSTGTIGFSGFTTGWEVDNIIISIPGEEISVDAPKNFGIGFKEGKLIRIKGK